MDYQEQARKNFLLKEQNLSVYAAKSSDKIRFKVEKEDIRPAYFHDIDRIIYSLSYSRYANKTQVYSFKHNDHISKRMVHVQLVSKIARTIGRSLNLNEDLIEAIALGHDIGHTPLGHTGESILNEISLQELNEYFAHNVQSVRNYMYIENNGNGLNLTVQVLDGIFCHNGEILSPIYEPVKKTKEDFLKEYNDSYKDLNESKTKKPMTLEGCVVRISDVIGYIGRDIEDAVILNKIKRSDIPDSITEVLGNTNKDIVNTIILDIVKESMNKPYIKMSNKVYESLEELKAFNYKHIYNNSLTKKKKEYYKEQMYKIYLKYLKDIEEKNRTSNIYKVYLNNQSKEYKTNTNNKRIVIDFIAGMTDEFFQNEIKLNKLEK